MEIKTWLGLVFFLCFCISRAYVEVHCCTPTWWTPHSLQRGGPLTPTSLTLFVGCSSSTFLCMDSPLPSRGLFLNHITSSCFFCSKFRSCRLAFYVLVSQWDCVGLSGFNGNWGIVTREDIIESLLQCS